MALKTPQKNHGRGHGSSLSIDNFSRCDMCSRQPCEQYPHIKKQFEDPVKHDTQARKNDEGT
jgi:hypothetical protein